MRRNTGFRGQFCGLSLQQCWLLLSSYLHSLASPACLEVVPVASSDRHKMRETPAALLIQLQHCLSITGIFLEKVVGRKKEEKDILQGERSVDEHLFCNVGGRYRRKGLFLLKKYNIVWVLLNNNITNCQDNYLHAGAPNSWNTKAAESTYYSKLLKCFSWFILLN